MITHIFLGYSQFQWFFGSWMTGLQPFLQVLSFVVKYAFVWPSCCVTKPFRFSEEEISMRSRTCSPSTTTWQNLSLLVPLTTKFVCIPHFWCHHDFTDYWIALIPSARDIRFSFWVVFHLCTFKLPLASFNAETLKEVVFHLLCTCKPILVILIT